MMIAQSDRTSAFSRKQSGVSLALAEGGMARSLAQLNKPNNAVLLNRNYDTINPETGKTYLGPDGFFNSGDEEASAIDEWTGYDPSNSSCYQQKGWGSPNFALTGSLGETGSYTVRAYRYNPRAQQGTLFIEASKDGRTTGVQITISVQPDLEDFPGVVLSEPTGNDSSGTGVLALRGRVIQGSKSNVYYHPSSSADSSLSDSAASGDSNRGSYLNAIWSSNLDGVSQDTVQGKIFACTLRANLPPSETGTDLGTIDSSTTIEGIAGKHRTYFTVDQIDLSGSEILTVDTTNGPVQIDIINNNVNSLKYGLTLRGTAKILNVRTDGQPPRVGDLRIIARRNDRITLYDQTCIQNAFLWFPIDELRLLTTGPGCPGGQNTNVEGVVWIEAILSSKNEATHRDVEYLESSSQDYDTTTKSGITSGIAVSEDIASVVDLLKYIDWPAKYRFGGVLKWQRYNLTT
ncbi:hypothetical protein [Acaryochloris marina]|nr:hypothetical protein [Acaryochloris marina]BDM79545.1 hypothetical protein AM10699_24130 [Acaryochloris marina MBIC10699]